MIPVSNDRVRKKGVSDVPEACPYCRTKKFRSMRNLEKIREIKEFRVRCSHHQKGCEWVGKLGDHLQSDEGCIHAEVKCHNFGFN